MINSFMFLLFTCNVFNFSFLAISMQKLSYAERNLISKYSEKNKIRAQDEKNVKKCWFTLFSALAMLHQMVNFYLDQKWKTNFIACSHLVLDIIFMALVIFCHLNLTLGDLFNLSNEATFDKIIIKSSITKIKTR